MIKSKVSVCPHCGGSGTVSHIILVCDKCGRERQFKRDMTQPQLRFSASLEGWRIIPVDDYHIADYCPECAETRRRLVTVG